MKWARILVVLVVAFLLVAAWASDFITPQGERTVYTGECEGGHWQEGRCSGRMFAGVSKWRWHVLDALPR